MTQQTLRILKTVKLQDATNRIVFTCLQRLTEVSLPRKAQNGDTAYGDPLRKPEPNRHRLGWEDIKDPQIRHRHQTYMEDPLPGGPVERSVEYDARSTRCDR
jgi:hypothetical protein